MAAASGKRLVFGVVSGEAAKSFRSYQPLVDYLAAELVDFGIDAGEVRVTQDLNTMVRWMRSGQVDLYMDSLYPASFVSERAGAPVILLRRKRRPYKYTVFLARADSGLGSLSELQGRTLALEERSSTTGFLLPLGHLFEQGLQPLEHSGLETPVAADEIGYAFSVSDQNAVQWVFSGRVAAAAVDNETFEEWIERDGSSLVVLARTEPVLRHHLVMHRPDLAPELRQGVEAGLLAMEESEAGRAVLRELDVVEFYLPPEDLEQSLQRVRQLSRLLEARGVGGPGLG